MLAGFRDENLVLGERGYGMLSEILSPKVHLILFIPERKTGVLGIWEVGEGGGSPIPKSKSKNIDKILTFW